MRAWSHTILEAYCMFDSMSRKKWKMYEWLGNGKFKKANTIENGNYIPKSERPEWCKKNNEDFLPQFTCLSYGKEEKRCPFFGYTNADKKDYMMFGKGFDKGKKE